MKDIQHEPILGAVIKHLLGKLNFSTVFSESMRNIEINESFLESFCNRLQLSLLEKIVIGLALYLFAMLIHDQCQYFPVLFIIIIYLT